MPTKLAKSFKKVSKSKRVSFEYQHDYIKQKPLEELIEKHNNSSTRPKDRRKIKNELVRRGGVVFQSKDILPD